MKKAVISVFVVLALVLNVFGFGILEASSSAMAEAIGVTLLSVIAGFLSGTAAGLSGEVAAAIPNAVLNKINSDALANGEVITITESGGNEYFTPANGLDSDTEEFASFFCDYLNSHDSDTMIAGFEAENGGLHSNINVSGALYADAKSKVVNAFASYLEAKRVVGNFDNYQTAMSELASALGTEWDPSYQFSFVGPLTPAQLSDVNSIHSIDFEGVHFYAPTRITYIPSDGWWSKAFIEALGGYDKGPMTATGYSGWFLNPLGYGGASYIIYNNDIYFQYYHTRQPSKLQNEEIFISTLQENDLRSFINCNGVALSNVVNSIDDLIGSSFGIYAWNTSGPAVDRPIISDVPSDTDFIDTSAGGTLDPGLTDEEAAIGSAIGLGIISDNPTLEFDNEGNLISADGISLATLQSLVQELVDKTYSFESFEEYLQTITQLLQASNVNTDKIDDVLTALRSWESSQADALDDINAAISAAASSITSALEISASDAELDLPDLDADTFIVSHSGLAEAATIINSIPIVGQVSQLFNNLLDSSQYDNSPPDFRFYADLDNNGVSETYNAFDLSFLEYDLTNGNLADSDRFQNRLTIRQFLQYLIIFICYVAFAIRILKKLPSIFGADEGSNDFKSSEK